MKLRNIGLPLVVLVASIAVGEEGSDGMCKLSSDKKGSTSLDAVPSVNIKSIAQGRRLPSLDDKTFALVGGSFMASVTHSELKRLILAEFPKAKVILLNEIGSAGPYPRLRGVPDGEGVSSRRDRVRRPLSASRRGAAGEG